MKNLGYGVHSAYAFDDINYSVNNRLLIGIHETNFGRQKNLMSGGLKKPTTARESQS